MKKIILHIGPGKCGSSTIQNFFLSHMQPCVERTNFILLNPEEIYNINRLDPPEESLVYFTKLLNENNVSDVIILSHEVLFQSPYAIKNICSISADKGLEILLVGYSRRQSDFMISSYSQWLFRSWDRVKEVKDAIVNIGIEPLYFSGIERHLIAAIATDFYSARQISNATIFNWNDSYQAIEILISSMGAEIRCGVLPDKDSLKNLIEDFCGKSGLTIKNELKETTDSIVNSRLNSDLIEALINGTEFRLDVPGPNSDNPYLSKISNVMRSGTSVDDEFIFVLKQYIDSCFSKSNIEFCRKYGIRETYFNAVNENSKNEILQIIKNEEQRRTSDTSIIKKYKELSAIMAETCLKMIRELENPN